MNGVENASEVLWFSVVCVVLSVVMLVLKAAAPSPVRTNIHMITIGIIFFIYYSLI